ncbi:hypothetical protein KFL_000900300 [Klebsormidium nitens]|uniref:Transmembrane protein 45B n=1 Tax=Klebsormidium nitens TaxID=105231 RepID=A0A0U9HN39_KLENI|nr:hypothetical protein KFL_000900300 [Klebsormidium nitens]|eukprot:GAQ81774.1 hypothetical protein KFL_000900300 [Klebsormidium nitens]
MGAFLGHLVPGLAFVLIGAWHLFNILRTYARSPRHFRSQPWWPAARAGQRRYAELYAIIFAALFDIAVELVVSPHFKPLADGKIPATHLNNFEHAAMLFLFLIYGLVALVAESTDALPLPDGFLHVLVSICFALEYLLFTFHSTTHMGLEGHFHALLLQTIGGVWFVQTGATLYLAPLIPSGCVGIHDVPHGGVKCDTEEALHRATGIANLQFAWWLAAVVVLTVVAYGAAVHFFGHGRGGAGYEFVQKRHAGFAVLDDVSGGDAELANLYGEELSPSRKPPQEGGPEVV